MRRLVLLLLASCATRAAAPPEVASAPEMPAPDVHGALPAGLCDFQSANGNSPMSTYDGCGETAPRFAAVEGPFRDVASAQRALDAARTEPLPPGYPFAATLSELTIEDWSSLGIVVVRGLYAYEADVPRGPRTRVVALQRAAPLGYEGTTIVEMLEDAPAYAYGGPGYTVKHEAPLCSVRRGQIFWTDHRERDRIDEDGKWYVAVACGERRAFVRLRATRVNAIVYPSEGKTLVEQIVEGGGCDSRSHETRVLRGARLQLAVGVCLDKR
jgi:hypothetical protein